MPHLASSLLQSASFQRPSRKLRHVRGNCPMGVWRRPLIPGLLSRPCGVTMSISSLSHIHSPYTLPPCECYCTTPLGRTRFRHPQHQRPTYTTFHLATHVVFLPAHKIERASVRNTPGGEQNQDTGNAINTTTSDQPRPCFAKCMV